MDLKGITWVGHVYQKFEAMCLEVEEIVYQDTVKFVENQVESVGASVKRFCSDVMQDLLPPSSMDLVKGAVPLNLPAEQNTDVGISKKPKVALKEESMKVDSKLLTDDSLATADWDKDAGHGSSFYEFHINNTSFQPSSGHAVKGVCSDVHSKEYDKRSGHNQSNLGVLNISNEGNFLSSETFLSCELLDKNQEATGDNVVVNPIPISTEVAGCKSIEKIHYELENASKGASGDLTNSPSSQCFIENLSACSSCSSLSTELNDICTDNGAVSLVGSSVNADVKSSEFPDKLTFICQSGRSDYSTMDTIESIIILEQGFETVQQIDDSQIEETCILVNGDDFHCIPCKEGKYKPYKKKIQEAISSRIRSSRKQKYEQLATWHGEDVKSMQEFIESKRSPSQGSCEFEWELL